MNRRIRGREYLEKSYTVEEAQPPLDIVRALAMLADVVPPDYEHECLCRLEVETRWLVTRAVPTTMPQDTPPRDEVELVELKIELAVFDDWSAELHLADLQAWAWDAIDWEPPTVPTLAELLHEEGGDER